MNRLKRLIWLTRLRLTMGWITLKWTLIYSVRGHCLMRVRCNNCGKRFGVKALNRNFYDCPGCLRSVTVKESPLKVQTLIPLHMSARNEVNAAGNARQAEWMRSDEAKKMHKEDGLSLAKRDSW